MNLPGMGRGMKRLVITEVDNGWFVKILDSGKSPLREPYEHGRLVFNQPDEFVEWVDKFFDIPGKMKIEEEETVK